jgi:phosphatidylserine/phosphatidylglycerophosphate/cardiolipin synthase-like enzyme
MRVSIFAQTVLLILFAGCASKQVRTEWIEPVVEFNADTMLVCDDPAEPGCAVPTPFDELLETTSKTPEGITPHYVNLLNIGNDALLIRIHLIRAARKSIYIQQFIWVADESGSYIFWELVKAARRGVEVKIVSDHLATIGDANKMAGVVVAHENLEFKIYNPTIDELETSHL